MFQTNIIRHFHLLMNPWTAHAVYICNEMLSQSCVEFRFVHHIVMKTMMMWSMIVDIDVNGASSDVIAKIVTIKVCGLKSTKWVVTAATVIVKYSEDCYCHSFSSNQMSYWQSHFAQCHAGMTRKQKRNIIEGGMPMEYVGKTWWSAH